MPHRTYGVEEVARYLHLALADVEKLVKNQDIPCERHGERLVFRKVEIDAWASRRILGLEGRGLTEYHRKTSQDLRQLVPSGALMPQMMEAGFIEPALPAKTKASVVREMAALAERTGRVYDPAGLRAGIEAREELCSTGVPGGLALMHSRFPDAYMFESPFIVLGRTVQEIPFGAPDGQATTLFFLLCCPDDRLHLHTLARVCMMAQKTDLLARLREAPDGPDMLHTILAAEAEVLEAHRVAG
jgi:excisionase family DNA binding protein